MPAAESPFEEVTSGHRLVRAATPPRPPRPPLDPRRKRRLVRIITLVLALALVAGGIWWWLQPRAYHLVGQFRSGDVTIIPCTQGFFLRESLNSFVLRDWRSGKICWQAMSARPMSAELMYAVSSNGRFFAVLTDYAPHARLQIWDNGTLICDRIMTQLTSFGNHLKALDDGRVFVWMSRRWNYEPTPTPALLLHGDQVVASGQVLDSMLAAMSPDGQVMMAPYGLGFEYAAIRVQGKRIAVAQRYRGNDPINLQVMNGFCLDSNLFAGGILLAKDGALYQAAGKKFVASGWTNESVAPGGKYTYQHRGAQARVYSPVSGDNWTFNVPGRQQGGDATENGRFALAWYHRGTGRRPTPYADGIPWMSNPFSNYRSRETLALYERPGKLRAILPLRIHTWWHDPSSPPEAWWWYPSPDGHSIVINIAGNNGSKCLLFRW